MRTIGFSTGAVARGNFHLALDVLRAHGIRAVELSALRIQELQPLMTMLPGLDLKPFTFVSVHAPSRFNADLERRVVDRLAVAVQNGYPIVVHPDVIFTPAVWRDFGDKVLLENMDKRRPVGRNVREMLEFFDKLPAARFCFDIGHARQVDPTMTEASLLLRAFGDRLSEVHISEVNTSSRHDPISLNAVTAFRSVASRIPEDVPVILETLIDSGQSDILTEIQRARDALTGIPVSV